MAKSKWLIFLLLFSISKLWSQQIDFFDNIASSTGSPVLMGTCSDADNNMYICGQTAGYTLYLFNSTYGTPYSGSYTFLAKVDSNFQLIWYRLFECYGGGNEMHGMVADDDGNLYYSVSHGNTNVWIDTYQSDGTFTIKLDSNGIIQWFKPYYSDKLRLTANNKLQLIGASNDLNLVEGTYAITNPSGTVITLDTGGVYQSHFFIDNPAYQSERLYGVNNQNQFYGYRASNGTPTLVSAFLVDTNGTVVYSKRINYCPSFALPFNMTYDELHEKYFVIGRFEVNVPMDTNVNVAPFGNQNAIMQLDNQFNIGGYTPLSVRNGNGGTAPSLAMHTNNGDLFIANRLSNSSLTYTHVGPHYYLNFPTNTLWMAKVDQNLQLKWCKPFYGTYFAGRFTRIWDHDNFLGVGGNTNLIPGIPPPYNSYSGADIFIGTIKDLDSTDITFTGKVFYDLNVNGSFDIGEFGVPDLQCTNTDTSVISFTNSNGIFNLSGQPGFNLIRSLTIPQYWARSTPDSMLANITSLDTSVQNIHFGIFPIPGVTDLRVVANDYHPAVMYASYPIKLDYYNLGTDTVNSVLKLIIDTVLTYTGSTVPPSSISGDTLTWNLDSLHFFNEGSIVVSTWVPTNIMYLGDSVFNYASIVSLLADSVPFDNYDTIISVMIAPVDPNDKTSIPANCFYESFIQNEQSIDYKIRFQNTGTSPAINVYIVDTLSDFLDPSTIQIISSSHSCYPIYDDGVLTFYFDNINLPDSGANYDASCGYVRYSIQPVANLTNGDVIGNEAEIYFDFNPPVYTGATYLHYYDEPVSILLNHPNCPQANDGSIQLVQWCSSLPALFTSINGLSFDSIGTYTLLAEGSYDIYIVDDGDTLLYSTVNLVDPPVVNIDSVNFIPNTCGFNNGSLQVFASGQSAGLSYSIDGVGFSPSPQFNNLPVGDYPVFVQDSSGCEYQWNDSIHLFTIYDLTIDTFWVTPANCPDDSTASLQVFVNGQSAAVYYSINAVDYFSTSLFTGLPTNTYQVIATDSLCSDSVDIVVTSLSNINANVSFTPVSSLPANGSITVNPYGGFYPYTFSINGGAFGPDSIFNDLDVGTYNITVMDSLGCTETFMVDIYSNLGVGTYGENNFFVYPNPATDVLFISGNTVVNNNYTMYNMFGQRLFNGILDETNTVQIHKLAAGTYFLEINNRYWKFIKVNQ